MTRTKINKLVSVFLSMIMTIAFWTYVPRNAVYAQSRSDAFSKSYSLGSDPGQNMVNIAFAQEGKKGTELGYTEDWCADFVSDCAVLAGQSSVIPHNAIVRNLANAIKGTETSTPTVGDICIFDWNSVSGQYDHVEIVYKVSGNTVYTIGGNAGSTGSYKTNYVKTRNATATGQVQCYIHPYYNDSVNPPSQNNDDELGIPYPRPQVSSTVWLGKNGITSGDYVRWLQTALNKADNAGLAVDGAFGSGTTTAVKNFQAKYGLTQDGQAGTNTINKLVELLKPSTVPTGSEMSKGAGQTIADGDYWIESALSKRYLVDIAGNNYDTANGTNLKMHLWDSDTFGKYDAFTFKYLNNGFYQITQRTTNMSIDVNGGSNERGANVQMYKSNNSTAQQWSITKTSDGYKLQAKCSGFCLDVYGGNVENNSNLNVWEDNGTKAQRFNLIPYKCTHSFGSWTTSKSATCTADGTQTRKCSECGYSESKTIAKTGHTLGNWTTSKNATCTADGTQVRKCSKCSYSESKTIAKTGHSLGEWTTSKAATCTADGTQVRKCSKCSYSEEKTIAKTGHSLGDWTTSKNATCTADGTQVRKCSKCSYSEEKAIAKTGHKYTDKSVAPTCTEKGYTLHTCSSCNDSYKDKETNAKGHTFTSKMIGGYMTYVCSDCGYMYTAPFEGEGTEESPFIISNADELRAVSETVNNTEINPIFGHAYYKQTADIDLENISWTPIGLGHNGEDGKGEYNYQTRVFYGVYDGNQHTIYNLNVDNDWIYSGLFAIVRGTDAKVCNLVVYGNVTGLNLVGGIVGELQYKSAIENCAFIGNITDAKICAGGIAGRAYNAVTIRNCYHNGTVTCTGDAGGITGDVSFNKYSSDDDSTLIENCYHVNGEISGEKSGAISSCCIYGDGKTNSVTIKNCYASSSSNYDGRMPDATYDNTMILPDSMLKKIASDLGVAYVDNTNSELNNGFPVFPWQLDIMLKGDADNNGVVDVNDAIMLQEWLLGASEELTNWENVDLCEDGVIDVFDLCLLKRLLAENAE